VKIAKIVVLLKQTPDTEASIQLAEGGKTIGQSNLKYIVNPYDEYAIEEALKLKEQQPEAEVLVVCFGRASAKENILKALAMGADRGMLIDAAGLEDLDSLSVAKILAAAIKSENAEVVFCGKQGIDDDNMHVGAMTAELLNWPHVNVVISWTLNAGTAVAEREVENGQVEVYEVGLPAVFGAHKSLNNPRYASLPGIMKAKRKPLDVKTPGDFGMTPAQLTSSAKVSIAGYTLPPPKAAGKVFKDEPVDTMVAKVVDLLRREAKVI
jgi:electron transfer flavoprotein beta subunit